MGTVFAMESKVVEMNPESVFNDIEAFLAAKAMKSENTRMAYETDMKQFFAATRGKEIEYLTLDDLQFKHTEVVRYMHGLTGKFKHSTVNRKMASIKELFRFLKRDHAELRPEVFDVDRLDEVDSESYGDVKWTEVLEMISRLLNPRDGKVHYKAEEKALLIEMAAKTSIRKDALLNITWNDITYNDAEDVWVVSVIDKGRKEDEKPISPEFYERLLHIKKNPKVIGDTFVFHLDKKTLDSMIGSLCDEMGIPASRNIKFHSLKKSLINWVIENGGDVVAAARQGNHSNINTMYKYYLDKKRKFKDMPGIMVDGEIDFSKIEDVNSADLLDAIMSCSPSVKAEILAKLGKK